MASQRTINMSSSSSTGWTMLDFTAPAKNDMKHSCKAQPAPASSLPLNLTFGVELEFILIWLEITDQEYDDDWHPTMDRAQQLIHNAISQPVKAKCAICAKEYPFHIAVQGLRGDDDDDYTGWKVDLDTSVELQGEERKLAENMLVEYSIELVSPIFRYGRTTGSHCPVRNADHTHAITYDEEIRAILAALKARFNGSTKSQRSRLVVNHTCGLHVHVGNDSDRFPLQTVKQIMSTYLVNERLIDSMHEVDRISGSTLVTERLADQSGIVMSNHELDPPAFNRPISQSMIASTHMELSRMYREGEYEAPGLSASLGPPAKRPPNLRFDREAWARLIDQAGHLNAVQLLQFPWQRNSTVNITNLSHPEHIGTDTVEFRQHAGSLDADEIEAWVEFLIGMVQYCHNTGRDEFQQRLSGEWLSHKHNLGQMLTTLKCNGKTTRHYLDRANVQSQGPGSPLKRYQAELKAVSALPKAHDVRLLVEYMAKKTFERSNPFNVLTKVGEKFKAGGYGQFSEKYLDSIKWDDKHRDIRQRLAIGWINDPALEKLHRSPSMDWTRTSSPSTPAGMSRRQSLNVSPTLSMLGDLGDLDDSIEDRNVRSDRGREIEAGGEKPQLGLTIPSRAQEWAADASNAISAASKGSGSSFNSSAGFSPAQATKPRKGRRFGLD